MSFLLLWELGICVLGGLFQIVCVRVYIWLGSDAALLIQDGGALRAVGGTREEKEEGCLDVLRRGWTDDGGIVWSHPCGDSEAS